MDINRLIDEVFPIKIYENDYYPCKLSMSEKFYLAIFDKCRSIDVTDIIMAETISKSTLARIKHKLQKECLIPKYEFTSESAKQFTIKNSHIGKTCEWCGKECYVLHKHHYPIKASDGGTKTVLICPNCHATYHAIMGG